MIVPLRGMENVGVRDVPSSCVSGIAPEAAWEATRVILCCMCQTVVLCCARAFGASAVFLRSIPCSTQNAFKC